MTVQTAGEQRYYDFIGERVRSLRTGMIVWISLLAVALIAGWNHLVIGTVLGIVGIILAVLNLRSQRELRRQLEIVGDKDSFFNQLIAPDTVEIVKFHLLITEDYILAVRPDVVLYRLCDMKKIEVGLGRDDEKALFLTDKEGIRHELIRTREKQDADFEQAYQVLKHKFG